MAAEVGLEKELDIDQQGVEEEDATTEQPPVEGEGEPLVADLDEESRDDSEDNHRAHIQSVLEANWEELEEEALALFKKLLQVDTQNFGDDGSEIEAVKILQEKFDEAGVPYEVVEPRPGRGNIVARITGDASTGKRMLLLSGHLDTVRAPKENWVDAGWKHDPYGAIIDEEDGCMYGRGAIDMKNMVAMSATILCFIKKKGISLTHDLVFAGLADEERTSSKWGVKYLVENRPELIEADVVFNEVGGFSYFMEGRETFPIQIGEKGSAQIKITAHGPGGHGSLYHRENPIATIGEVVQTLHSTRLPLRVNCANRSSIESISSVLPFPKSFVFRQLLNATFSDMIANRLLSEEQMSSLVPLLHNTANPTIIEGGEQVNQIPSFASVIVDSRILPECTVEHVVYDIKHVLGPSRFLPQSGPDGEEVPPELTLEVLCDRNPHFQDPSEAECQAVFDVLRKVLSARAEGSCLITSLIPGGTDSFYYARNPRRKPICLGFSPVRFPEGMPFSKLFHGVNERIPVDGFKWGVRVLTEVVMEITAAKIFF